MLFKHSLSSATGYRKIISNVGKSPSQSAKSKEYWNNQRDPIQVIHDGRHSAHAGLSTVAPPVQIFHPAFNTFTQVSRDPDIEPTNEGLRKVQELMHLLSAIGQYEVSRNQAIRLKLSEILGVQVHEEPNADRSSADGVYMIIVNNIRITILIVELKRELGDGGSDPSTQAGLMMKRSWQQATVSQFLIDTGLDSLFIYLILLAQRDSRQVLLPYADADWRRSMA